MRLTAFLALLIAIPAYSAEAWLAWDAVDPQPMAELVAYELAQSDSPAATFEPMRRLEPTTCTEARQTTPEQCPGVTLTGLACRQLYFTVRAIWTVDGEEVPGAWSEVAIPDPVTGHWTTENGARCSFPPVLSPRRVDSAGG